MAESVVEHTFHDQGPPPAEDDDPEETREWLEALQAIVARAGPSRGLFLLKTLQEQAQKLGIVSWLPPQSGSVRQLAHRPVEVWHRPPGHSAFVVHAAWHSLAAQ